MTGIRDSHGRCIACGRRPSEPCCADCHRGVESAHRASDESAAERRRDAAGRFIPDDDELDAVARAVTDRLVVMLARVPDDDPAATFTLPQNYAAARRRIRLREIAAAEIRLEGLQGDHPDVTLTR